MEKKEDGTLADEAGIGDRKGDQSLQVSDPTETGSGPALPSILSTDWQLHPLPRAALEGGHR